MLHRIVVLLPLLGVCVSVRRSQNMKYKIKEKTNFYLMVNRPLALLSSLILVHFYLTKFNKLY